MKNFLNSRFSILILSALLVSCKKDNNSNSATPSNGSIDGVFSPAGTIMEVAAVSDNKDIFTTTSFTAKNSTMVNYSIPSIPAGTYAMYFIAPTGYMDGGGKITLGAGEHKGGTSLYSQTWGDIGSHRSGSTTAYNNGSRQVIPNVISWSQAIGAGNTSPSTPTTIIRCSTSSGDNLFITVQNFFGVGTYSLADSKVAMASYKSNGIVYTTLRNGSGSITFTKSIASFAGTFSFVAYPIDGNASAVNITNGSFELY